MGGITFKGCRFHLSCLFLMARLKWVWKYRQSCIVWSMSVTTPKLSMIVKDLNWTKVNRLSDMATSGVGVTTCSRRVEEETRSIKGGMKESIYCNSYLISSKFYQWGPLLVLSIVLLVPNMVTLYLIWGSVKQQLDILSLIGRTRLI